MILNERDLRHELVLNAAKEMMAAARTAPKGKGIDAIEICTLTGDEIGQLSRTMYEMYEKNGFKFFLRDADNILSADAIVLIGTREQPQGLDCCRCGFPTCASRQSGVPCALNTVDVGIAVGSACSKAADLRMDTRIMFSAGEAAMKLGWPTPDCNNVLAIPISVSSKNPFFDRKPKEEK